ncbi:MAG: hypothetical protein Q9182_003949 [Xanthomendoza sp. 2 TL-2023]
MAPAEGFAEIGLAKLFGSDFVAPSATAPSTTPAVRDVALDRTRRAVIAGAVVGASVLMGLAMAAGWFFRKSLYRMFTGDLAERVEVDGKSKAMSELPAKGVFWELPGNAPAELWTPTETTSETNEMDFKHETKSDRELGWRGEIECLGDLAKIEYVVEVESQEDTKSSCTRVSSEEMN